MIDIRGNAPQSTVEVMGEKKFYVGGNPNLINELYAGTTEKTIQDSSYDDKTQLKPYNPDDLYQKTGTYSIYESMRVDDQAHVCLELKKDLVLGSGFDIVSEKEGTEDIAKDLKVCLTDDQDRPFTDQLKEILTSYDYGVSFTEKIFKRRKDGSLTLKELKTRYPDTWLIWTDNQGNIEKLEQQGVSSNVKVNPKSVILYTNKQEFQNLYGQSDLRVAYEAWFAKTQIIRYLGIFVESNSKPIPVGKYDQAMTPAQRTMLFNALKRFQQKTALLIPKEVEVEFLEAKSKGEVYKMAIDLFNMFIGRAMMVPDLLGFQGSETSGGSLALGGNQLEIFFRHIASRRTSLEHTVNRHIVQPLAVFNYGIMENFPKFKLNPITEDDIKESAKTWLEAVKARAYRPNDEEINHFRKAVNFPEGDVQREMPAEVQPPSDEESDKISEPTDDAPEPSTEEKDKLQDDVEKGNFALQPFNAIEGDFHKRVDFQKVENQMENTVDKMTTAAEPVIEFMMDDMLEQIDKKKILQGHPERIDKLKLKKLRELNTILNAGLRGNYMDAQKMAQSEILKRNFAEPLPAKAFIDVLNKENFAAIGDWEFYVDQQVRLELTKAIKDGKNLPDLIEFTTDTKEELKTRFERYSRTKTTETFNKGRVEFFEQSGIVAGYQYSAVLDGVTTAICRGLHGKQFKAGTEPIPPMHFNCRSVLIPITMFEEVEPAKRIEVTPEIRKQLPKDARESFTGSKSVAVEDFIEQTKGKGFAKR